MTETETATEPSTNSTRREILKIDYDSLLFPEVHLFHLEPLFVTISPTDTPRYTRRGTTDE